jgi:hypothetical protein
MRFKSFLLGSACLAALAALPAVAQAQSTSDVDKIDRMQRQMEQLQDQIKTLKVEMAQSKKKATELQASGGAYAADLPAKAPYTKAAPSVLDRVHMTWGGFLAAESVYRTHNAESDIGSPFTGVPFPYSPLYNEGEFHGSARQSRISLLLEGDIAPAQKLTGYYEMDFLGVGVTSNYNQSNSWAPRLRQGFLEYDNAEWGFHFLAGQAWSLATQNTSGITARKENIPLTIDPNYVVGFDFTRNWQIRLVKDFAPWFALGVSVENPAEEVYTSSGGIASGGVINGQIVNFTNAGSSFLGQGGFTNSFNTDTAPDIIEKAAFDPGFGHYEVFGIERFFQDNIFTCSTVACPLTTADVGPASSKITTGEGVGGSLLVPVLPKFLDLTASTLYGRGIGRYGASQLSDVVVGSDGSLKPITAIHFLGGLIAHPWAGLDVYAYGGFEKADSNYFTSNAGALTGFGVPNSNAGCSILTAASFTGGTNNCAGINKQVSEITVGFWQDLYKGNYGRLAAGFQYEYVRRETFPDATGLTASTNDNVFLTSFRYYPF